MFVDWQIHTSLFNFNRYPQTLRFLKKIPLGGEGSHYPFYRVWEGWMKQREKMGRGSGMLVILLMG